MILLVADAHLSESRARQIAAATPEDGCPEFEPYETVDFVNTHRATPVLLRLAGAALGLGVVLSALAIF